MATPGELGSLHFLLTDDALHSIQTGWDIEFPFVMQLPQLRVIEIDVDVEGDDEVDVDIDKSVCGSLRGIL